MQLAWHCGNMVRVTPKEARTQHHTLIKTTLKAKEGSKSNIDLISLKGKKSVTQ